MIVDVAEVIINPPVEHRHVPDGRGHKEAAIKAPGRPREGVADLSQAKRSAASGSPEADLKDEARLGQLASRLCLYARGMMGVLRRTVRPGSTKRKRSKSLSLEATFA